MRLKSLSDVLPHPFRCKSKYYFNISKLELLKIRKKFDKTMIATSCFFTIFASGKF